MDINSNITKIREYYQWSQQDLANKANISASAISMIEAGLRTPSISNLIKISDAFCLSREELIKGEIIHERMIHAKYKVLDELCEKDKETIHYLINRLREN